MTFQNYMENIDELLIVLKISYNFVHTIDFNGIRLSHQMMAVLRKLNNSKAEILNSICKKTRLTKEPNLPTLIPQITLQAHSMTPRKPLERTVMGTVTEMREEEEL